MLKRTMIIALLAACAGCSSQAQYRTNRAGAAFTAMLQGMTREEPVLHVCLCESDYDCERKCGGRY